MWTKIKILLFFVVVAVLQTTFSPRIALFNVKPDLLLISAVIWGISYGAFQGGAVGFVAGLLEDLLSTGFYINTLIKAIVGFSSGVVRGNIAVASTLICTIAVASLTPLSYILELLIFYFFFGRPLPSAYSTLSVIFLSSIYNSILTAALSPILLAIIDRVGVPGGGDLQEHKLYRI